METAALLMQSYPFDFDGEALSSAAFPAEMLMHRVIDIPTDTHTHSLAVILQNVPHESYIICSPLSHEKW